MGRPRTLVGVDEKPIGRRVALGVIGAGLTGIVFGARVQDVMERVLGPITVRDGTGLSSFLPVGRFRIYSVVGRLPRRDEADYRLRIDGAVRNALTLTMRDLRAFPPLRVKKDFQCVTGWRVHDVKWTGVRLADVLDRAGVNENAGGVVFRSFDGAYTESLTVAQARRDDVMVAYELEGKPLSSMHGGPARLYVAPMYGYKSLKWLESIEVVTGKPAPGYWEQRGYDTDAWIGRSNGRDDPAV